MNSMLFDHEFMNNNIFKFNPEFSTFEESFQNLDHLSFDQIELNNHYVMPSTTVALPQYLKKLPSINRTELNETNSSISHQEIPDFPDDCLKFMSDILLEETFNGENHISPQEYNYKALQDTEKSLYDALGAQYPYPYPDSSDSDQIVSSPDDGSSIKSSGSIFDITPTTIPKDESIKRVIKTTKAKKSRRRNHEGDNKDRVNKIQATTNEDYVEMEQYDDVLLCSEYEYKKLTNFSPKRIKKQIIPVDEVDLNTLLTQCAQAVSTFDLRTANDLLKQIRQHATPYGDSKQRLAHHMACGLEARLAGTGSTFSTDLVDVNISTPDFLKAYSTYVSSIPFKRMSFFVANTTILNVVKNATKIHIIDFGIFLGLQWPCLIKRLSKFANGPPTLRITGIDFPQQGFRPSERIDATGCRLSGYCERFGVPFTYNGIVDKWENIKLDDIKIVSDEIVIVNCMYRSGTLLDETVDANSPRDKFLKLVRGLNPRLFVHGVINGTFNAPFFLTRFREALFHYSSVFEVFEATLPRESRERLLIESEAYGKEVYNLVACEGAERVQRPESYKQWRIRQTRAGLKMAGLDKELVSRAKVMVKGNYHGDFLVDEDKNWMLQGWKGRIFCALSFWRPQLQ